MSPIEAANKYFKELERGRYDDGWMRSVERRHRRIGVYFLLAVVLVFGTLTVLTVIR